MSFLDSLVDFELETSLLGDIYRGSVCTIPLSSAMDRLEGLSLVTQSIVISATPF